MSRQSLSSRLFSLLLVLSIHCSNASAAFMATARSNLIFVDAGAGTQAPVDGGCNSTGCSETFSDTSTPSASRTARAQHPAPDDDNTRAVATGRASSTSNKAEFRAAVVVNSHGKKASASANGSAFVEIDTSGITGDIEYAPDFRPLSGIGINITLNGRPVNPDGDIIPNPGLVSLFVGGNVSTSASGSGLQGGEVKGVIMIKEVGKPAKGEMRRNGTNNYDGNFPTKGSFGRTGPMYFTGIGGDELAFGGASFGNSQLTYTVLENSFTSIVLPGEVDGPPLLLSFEGTNQIVQPGTTFNFLPSYPGTMSVTLTGNGLSAGTETGFTFADDGIAEMALLVGVVPEPSSLFLCLVGSIVVLRRKRRQ